MDDLRKKVITGLECCILRDPDDHARCSQCSYGGNCVNRLKMDALELLKAQEPGWISVKDRMPEDDRAVLAVKQLKNGRRDMCLARCIPDYECYDVETRSIIKKPYWVCGGNNNIIYWMPLPKQPKEEL